MKLARVGAAIGVAIGVLALGGCPLYREGSIVGGPTLETTTVDCHDGTRCPLAFPSCPPPFSRPYGGKCEYVGPDYDGSRIRDAGRDAARDGSLP